ncbi:hypothetical protein HHI36_007327 [Cryptolaemus montrouzieri]|uniref:Uncharacterized protein n=1 Tax=Cryptolaemus montrouzieri TaxID=559131 RepID=A0ABD2MPB2_9CUCU
MCYLEGILILLNKEILNDFRVLTKDPISNIQDRAKYVLTRIKQFSEDLNAEIQSDWVLSYTNAVSENTWQKIDSYIAEQLEHVQSNCDNVEKVDTNLNESKMDGEASQQVENVEFVEKLEVFPSDPLKSETMNVDEMESVDEEKIKETKA